MASENRVIIVGAGHNGLVAAGYLARAGLKVEVLERRDVVGGAAVTEEWFLQMVDATALDDDFLDDVRALKTDSASLKFYCALRELPGFSAYLGPEFDPTHLAMSQVSPSLGYIESSWDGAMNGRLSRFPIMRVQIPTVYDPTLAPEGHHVISLWVTYEPSHLDEGSWSDRRQAVGEHLIDELSKYAPNLREAIIDWTVLTPEDIKERIGLTDGNIPARRHDSTADAGQAAASGLVGLSDADSGALPLRGRDPPRRRGYRRSGP